MADKNYLMIDADDIVRNCIVWDGETPYEPPEGWRLEEVSEGEYYEYGKKRGIEPPQPPLVAEPKE
jgi:hypothetical protein